MEQQKPVPTFSSPDPESLFLASRNGLRTFEDLYQYQIFFLQQLQAFHIDLAKPVAFLVDSCDELILALASCWRLGISFTCLNPHAPSTELNKQLDELDAGALIVEEDLASKVMHSYKIPLQQLSLQKAFSRPRGPNVDQQLDTDHHPDQVIGYFFTSGTSDTPKIVPLKRRQMLFAAYASAQNFRPDKDRFWLLCMPLNHIGGISIILRSLLYGSGIFRMKDFDKQMVATFLSENKLFQAASLVPTMLKRLIEIPAFQTHHDFKAILLGGGPIDTQLLERAATKGIPVVSSYGMTETCAQIAANPLLKPSGLYAPMKSVGRLFEPNQIHIRDDDGTVLSRNNSGNIWLKGPQIFDGYLNSDLNDQMFDEDGWFNTGDYGHMNVNGHLFIESRRSDLIISGGENVSPDEVETELERIDSIKEAAVLGVPDEEWGQRVVAAVVPNNGDKIQTSEIQQILKERITSFKVPKQIVSIDSLPKNRSGKVLRRNLNDLFQGNNH